MVSAAEMFPSRHFSPFVVLLFLFDCRSAGEHLPLIRSRLLQSFLCLHAGEIRLQLEALRALHASRFFQPFFFRPFFTSDLVPASVSSGLRRFEKATFTTLRIVSNMRAFRGGRGRSNGADRGGIRKRGPTRTDRDGDLDMDGGGRGRGAKRGRGDSGRSTPMGGQPYARDRALNAIQKAIANNSPQANIRRGKPTGGNLEQVTVRGWKQSKAASNPDGGVESLLAFLEKKLTHSDSKGPRAKITKSRVEGDALVVSVRPELVNRLLQINGFSFAGAPLTTEMYSGSETSMTDLDTSANGTNTSASDTKAKLTAILGKRYYQPTKVLDLSRLVNDPDLMAMGIFNSTSTESKFFPALMKVWEMNFDSPAQRREAVESVSLANNQLSNISVVTTLAQTFPDIKNLDLSNNNFKDAQALLAWRWKFRNLEFLDLSATPFSADPTFKDTMLKWYPKLRVLNNVEVRTAEEVAAQMKTPIPVQPPYFRDDSQIAENFVRAFFSGYDNDRNDLLNGIYDAHSTFSFNVNVAAPRSQQTETASWEQYIKKSRNLVKISHLTARMARVYVGAEKIRELWNSLPKTRHPDMLAHPEEWLVECHPIPGLPDPNGQSETGVGGLLIMVHGKFEELSASGKVDTRSFDRTFILGPGGGVGGLRVINDALCLRSYGGHTAWNMADLSAGPQPVQPLQPQPQTQTQTQEPVGDGMPAPGKLEARVQQEQLILQMSAKTKMTLPYSEMALSGNGWNFDAALKNFEELKAQGKLPADAFLPGTILQ